MLADSILNIILIGFTVSRWSFFHWNLFPYVCSVSSWSLIDCGIIFDRMLLQNDFSQLWFCVKVWWTVSCINVFICSVASTSLVSSGMNLKYLMKFSLSSCHMNVSPWASSSYTIWLVSRQVWMEASVAMCVCLYTQVFSIPFCIDLYDFQGFVLVWRLVFFPV